MFKDYEIRLNKNEEVLYLYIDLDGEYATFGHKRKKNIEKEVYNYINKKKISFKGKKVIIVAGGIILSTILLNTKPKQEQTNNKYQYISPIILKENINLDLNNYENITNIENEAQVIEKKNEEKPLNNSLNHNVENKNNSTSNTTTSNSNSKNEAINNSSNIEQESTNTSSNQVVNYNIENTNNENTNKENTIGVENNIENDINNIDNTTIEVPNNETFVTINRSNGTILNIEIEEYLIGVVASEMPASFHIEALKAQAIAARTYALKAIQTNQILTDTVKTQTYKDNEELKALWKDDYQTYYNKIKNAVNDTKGLAIYYNNSLINAFYFSTSNGYTENSEYVFGEYPYLKSVESPLDINASTYLKSISYTYEDISNKLNIPITSLSQITINRNESNRVSNITIDNNLFNGTSFRTLLALRSTDFDITLNDEYIVITTRGYGHGVGMSQYGANFYAKNGWSYKDIIKHYYTGVIIK